MTRDQVLARFENVTVQWDGSYLVSCPVPGHGQGRGDPNPSLHLTFLASGRLVWNCKAKCPQRAVREAAGLSGWWGEGGLPKLSGSGRPGAGTPAASPSPPLALAPAVVALRAWAYREALAFLRLLGTHRQHLLARGLTEGNIEAAGYKSLGTADQAALARQLHRRVINLRAIPGLVGEAGLMEGEGIVVPCRSRDRAILGLQVRHLDGPVKYQWPCGSSARRLVHVPVFSAGRPTDTVRLTEGLLKADVVAALDRGTFTIGVAGVGQWGAALPLLRELKARSVLLAFDQDRAGQAAQAEVAASLTGQGYTVLREVWDGNKAKGLDDVLLLRGVVKNDG